MLLVKISSGDKNVRKNIMSHDDTDVLIAKKFQCMRECEIAGQKATFVIEDEQPVVEAKTVEDEQPVVDAETGVNQ